MEVPRVPNAPIYCHVNQGPSTNIITPHGPFPFVGFAFTGPNIKLLVEEGIVDMQFRGINPNNGTYMELVSRSILRIK